MPHSYRVELSRVGALRGVVEGSHSLVGGSLPLRRSRVSNVYLLTVRAAGAADS